MNPVKFLIILPAITYPIFYVVVRAGGVPGAWVAALVWSVAFGVIVWWLAAAMELRVDEHVGEYSRVLRSARPPHE